MDGRVPHFSQSGSVTGLQCRFCIAAPESPADTCSLRLRVPCAQFVSQLGFEFYRAGPKTPSPIPTPTPSRSAPNGFSAAASCAERPLPNLPIKLTKPRCRCELNMPQRRQRQHARLRRWRLYNHRPSDRRCTVARQPSANLRWAVAADARIDGSAVFQAAAP
jgi:hypothetical protein